MNNITWQAKEIGVVDAIASPEHPNLVQLVADGENRQFNASGQFDVGPIVTTVRTTDYWAFYVETTTNKGRRQFKFTPSRISPKQEFGYRYSVGIGRELRDGELNQITLDLVTVGLAIESDIEIQSVDRIFARTQGSLDIDLLSNSTTEPEPPEEPPEEPPSGDITPNEAARFLTQATYGPTTAAISELTDTIGSYGAWIDQQIAAPISRTLPYVKANSNGSLRSPRHHIWFDNALNGEDQLRQRVALAWSELFVISDRDYVLANSQYGVSQYYDLLAEQGLGNFRDLLETVTLHPTMGVFLSMLANEKADPARFVRPDENYAREVLQLFTIGLYELDSNGQVRTSGGQPIPTYDQATIEEFARVFTGWNYSGQRRWYETNAGFQDRESPMVSDDEFHDTGSKRLLNGTVLPAGQTARQDMDATLDNIFNHGNVGPFISKHLIQRLVTSNPSPSYVGRIAQVFADDGAGTRGNLAAVVKAILLDSEARTGHQTQPATFGKLREPLLRVTQVFRAFDAQPGPTAGNIHATSKRTVDRIDEVVGQAVLRSRSVFNFFPPDNPLGSGDLVAPELYILSEVDVASTNNMFFEQIYFYNNRDGRNTAISRLNVEREVALAENPTSLVDHLDQLLTSGSLPDTARDAIIQHVDGITDSPLDRALDAMFLVIASPFHLVQK